MEKPHTDSGGDNRRRSLTSKTTKRNTKLEHALDARRKHATHVSVVLTSGTQVLLTWEKKYASWWLPGGEITAVDHDDRAAAYRSLERETGCTKDTLDGLGVLLTRVGFVEDGQIIGAIFHASDERLLGIPLRTKERAVRAKRGGQTLQGGAWRDAKELLRVCRKKSDKQAQRDPRLPLRFCRVGDVRQRLLQVAASERLRSPFAERVMTKMGWKKGEGIGSEPAAQAEEPVGAKLRGNSRRRGLKSSVAKDDPKVSAPVCLRGKVGRVEWALDDVFQLLEERGTNMSPEASGALRRGHHRLV